MAQKTIQKGDLKWQASNPEAVRAATVAFIKENLSRCDLSVELIQNYLGITSSVMYRLLLPAGGARKLIVTLRIHKAARYLLNQSASDREPQHLSKQLGFIQPAHFTRAFTSRFGMNPRQYRARIRESDPDWIAAQFALIELAERCLVDASALNGMLDRSDGSADP